MTLKSSRVAARMGLGVLTALALAAAGTARAATTNDAVRYLSREELQDKRKGAWTGMLIAGLEGLAHEFKYIEKPRATLPAFNVNITGGPCSDDDNDFELTHLYYMDKLHVLKIPYDEIVGIWKTNINTGVWCANLEARKLMDKGVVPPATGDPARNSFASFNLSGQFCMEMCGAVLGVRQGYSGLAKTPGFNLSDRYVNKTRPGLPREMTISGQVEIFLRVSEQAILENGGTKVELDGKPGYRIRLQVPSPPPTGDFNPRKATP